MSDSKNIHEGHRDRVRAEYLSHGYDENTPDHKILEHILFYALSRKDTNPIAHDLVRRFGNLAGVLDAPIEKLVTVDGISEKTAIMLKLYLDVFRIYTYEKQEHDVDFDSINTIGEYVYSRYLGLSKETFGVLGMSPKGKLLFFKFLSEGDISSVGVSVKDVIKLALDFDAINIVIAHNHPGGVALPSSEDVFITERIASALNQVGIKLYDHILVADDDFVSLRLSENYCHLFPSVT